MMETQSTTFQKFQYDFLSAGNQRIHLLPTESDPQKIPFKTQSAQPEKNGGLLQAKLVGGFNPFEKY